MTSVVATQLQKLCSLTSSNCQARGEKIIAAGEKASNQLLTWIEYLTTTHSTTTATCLLVGAVSAMRETLTCLTLGLVRPALNSMRLQIDLCVAWTYFKDHPIEWNRVQETGDGFKLKAELLRYLAESHPRFSARFNLLKDIKTRIEADPYRLLSAHIHGQSEFVLPDIQQPKDIVGADNLQDEAIVLQANCAEFVSDVFWSLYANYWATIPSDLRAALTPRFKSAAQKAIFFDPNNPKTA
jgi:hypothetical protein